MDTEVTSSPCSEVDKNDLEDKNKEISNNEENEINTSMKEMNTEEKKVKTRPEVFKKPVLIIGPRRGRAIGKIQVLKSTDPSDTTETNDPIVETREVLRVEREDLSENSVVTVRTEPEKDAVGVKVQKISPAEKLNENSVPLPYKEPKWSGIPTELYKFEVLKNGSIVETIDLSSKSYFVFGRLTTCDIHMAHPTVSRFHAVLQFRNDNTDGEIGFYVYDLGSTHGTFLNKYRIKPNIYVRIKVGHMLKLGGSSRMYILQGPEEDMEKESELSVTELKQKRREEQIAKDLQDIQECEELRLRQEKEEADGIDWGMGDDADEETDLSENPFAAAPNEELYLDDPKKTLRGWFEREGYDLEYDVEEKGFGQFLCHVEIPVESAKGGTVVAESLVKGKKKEAVVQCALEACRILDRYGLLRQAKHESRKRKVKNWEENDYYDSDEDEFLDRTGTVEKKRQQRMKAAGKIQTQTETYESLVKKHDETLSEIDRMQKELNDIQKVNKRDPEVGEDEDALDAFMTNLSKEVPDIKLINKLKSELLSLRKEEAHIRKLVNIACPASLPKLTEEATTLSSSSSSSLPKSKLAVGLKRKISSHSSLAKSAIVELDNSGNDIEHGEEEEEEEEEDVNEKTEDKVEKGGLVLADKHKMEVDRLSAFVTMDPAGKDHMETVIEEKPVTYIETTEHPLHKEATSYQSDIKDDSEHTQKSGTPKNAKVIGPTLPPQDIIPEEHAEKRKKRTRQRQNKKIMKESGGPSSSDPNYSMWVPPEDQSGDGRTKLNEKYGY